MIPGDSALRNTANIIRLKKNIVNWQHCSPFLQTTSAVRNPPLGRVSGAARGEAGGVIALRKNDSRAPVPVKRHSIYMQMDLTSSRFCGIHRVYGLDQWFSTFPDDCTPF